jgi:glycerophosphoryl diester phosphodiesterase
MTPPVVRLPRSLVTIPLAHRGYHDRAADRPELSMAAFRAAIEAGYGIELDVQLTADDQAVVFHDDTLGRMTDSTGPVAARTSAELARIHLFGTAETIPTLRQVVGLVSGRVPLLIEIKDLQDTRGPTGGQLERAVAESLADYPGPVAVMSFNPHIVLAMARLAPHLPRGLTTEYYDHAVCAPIPPATCDRLREIPDYEATGSSFISHRHTDLGQTRVADLKARGADILCWTIRSPADEAAARTVADNITFESYPAPITAPDPA